MAPPLSLPLWVTLWLVVSTIVVFLDVGFVLLRPHSMANGIYSHFPLWSLYPNYYKIDRLYADMDNAFLLATAYVNLIESAGNIIGLLLVACGRRATGFLLLLVSVTSTLMKTVTYFVHEAASSGPTHPTAHNFVPQPDGRPNNLFNYVFLYIVPNGLWIVFPLLVVITLASRLANAINSTSASTGKLKSK